MVLSLFSGLVAHPPGRGPAALGDAARRLWGTRPGGFGGRGPAALQPVGLLIPRDAPRSHGMRPGPTGCAPVPRDAPRSHGMRPVGFGGGPTGCDPVPRDATRSHGMRPGPTGCDPWALGCAPWALSECSMTLVRRAGEEELWGFFSSGVFEISPTAAALFEKTGGTYNVMCCAGELLNSCESSYGFRNAASR